jgi:hypothetical protein
LDYSRFINASQRPRTREGTRLGWTNIHCWVRSSPETRTAPHPSGHALATLQIRNCSFLNQICRHVVGFVNYWERHPGPSSSSLVIQFCPVGRLHSFNALSSVVNFLSLILSSLYTSELSKMSEKEQPLPVSEPSKEMDSQDQETRSEENPSVENPSEEKPSETVKTSIEDKEEPVPHLHAKTYLTVFAVCLIYFAQTHQCCWSWCCESYPPGLGSSKLIQIARSRYFNCPR